MRKAQLASRLPGATILGGAGGGFSYEGARNDALAREDAALRREAGHSRGMPKAKPAQPQPPKPRRG